MSLEPNASVTWGLVIDADLLSQNTELNKVCHSHCSKSGTDHQSLDPSPSLGLSLKAQKHGSHLAVPLWGKYTGTFI